MIAPLLFVIDLFGRWGIVRTKPLMTELVDVEHPSKHNQIAVSEGY